MDSSTIYLIKRSLLSLMSLQAQMKLVNVSLFQLGNWRRKTTWCILPIPLKTLMFSAAKALAELARKHSVDVTFDSPYSMEARSRVRNKYILSVILSLFTSFFNSFAKKCMISQISFRLLTCRVLMFLGGRSYLELS